MSEYNTVGGIVQFDPTEKKAGTQNVREFVIQCIGANGATCRVTLWPELAKTKVVKGDFIVAAGKFESRTVNGTVYHNLSCNHLVLNGKPVPKKAVEKTAEVEDDEDLLF